ncbi:adenylosuccinate lyase [Maribacter sp. 2307ULW6-5]|uniref:adenylosuccinate lyase n=1 Tax=Maribacter sp. 2307ULW6-5 TaxID=3386275 RepID=UPI0039BC4C3F
MNKIELLNALDNVDASRDGRDRMAAMVLADPPIFKVLLHLAMQPGHPAGYKAFWVLERVVLQDLALLLPHLDTFLAGLPALNKPQAVRPAAKICELLLTTQQRQHRDTGPKLLQKKHLSALTAICFDWLLGDAKVAPKAYAMTCLHLLGEQQPWIHPELKVILERDMPLASAGYRARAKNILKKLKAQREWRH